MESSYQVSKVKLIKLNLNQKFSTIYVNFQFKTFLLVSLPMNIVPESFTFAEQINHFDSNLSSANEYCTAIEENTTSQHTIIAPFQTIKANYNGVSTSNSNELLETSTEIPNNCITYSNVIFVPTITNNVEQMVDSIELVKREIETTVPEINDSTNSFKYVVSSDPRFVNTFVQTNNVDSSVLNDVTNVNWHQISNHSNQINQQIQQVEPIETKQFTVQMQPTNDHEVLLQDEHGQLYRQVPNIYVDGTSMCTNTNDLMPIISTPVEITDVDYSNHNIGKFPNYSGKSDRITFEIPRNYDTNSTSNSRNSNTVNTNAEMQEVEFIFNNYRNNDSIDDISQSSHIGSNQFETPSTEQNYHQSDINSNKEQSLLESTMSTLCKLKYKKKLSFFTKIIN